MTNQEAISTIKAALAQVEWVYPMEYAAAFDLAIQALEEREKAAAAGSGEDSAVPLIKRLREIAKIGIVNAKADTKDLNDAADMLERLDERIAIMMEFYPEHPEPAYQEELAEHRFSGLIEED